MTNETRNRIRAYMEELPFMKEKVFGALLMFVVAAVVAVSTTYAWVTLSQSPEVSEITTTLAANGALEIALSKPNGGRPDEYEVDESVTEDADVMVTNLQWGNLVNLSDTSYGIDKLDLRPASLETASLISNPLSGAVYGEDGRITRLNSQYTYTAYDGTAFVASGNYGVRAISSYKITSGGTALVAVNMAQAVTDARSKVDKQYNEGVVDKFENLGPLITRVAQDKVNKTDYAEDPNATDSNLAVYLSSVRNVYVQLEKTMSLQKDVFVALANLQRYLWSTAGDGRTYVPVTWADLERDHTKYNVGSSGTSTNGVIALTGLSTFVADYNYVRSDLDWLEQYVATYRADKTSEFYWSHHDAEGPVLGTMINRLISYNTMTVEYKGTEYTLTGIQAIAKDLVLSPQDTYNVYVVNGILRRFEQTALDAARMEGRADCTIDINTNIVDLTIDGKAHTKASGSSYIATDFAVSQNQAVGATTKEAEDTYGLVVDLWVRTNAEETCLTLEGAIVKDENNNTFQYQGVNRIWGQIDGVSLTTSHTTQGGGSCYTYYTDSPEDMARSLDLLKSMKIAFVSSAGTLLATAGMDTENHLAVNGRVTVPLVLEESGTTYTYTDNSNAEKIGRAITTLRTDEAVRITAIIYLDGNYLTNNQVLSAAKIQGSLNLQFGSSVDLTSVATNKHELHSATRTVMATASKTEMDFDNKRLDSDLITELALTIVGDQPKQVTAFFVREINSTQGTREPTMTFTRQDDGTWTKEYEFTSPGIYSLRHVRLDGVDYALADPVEITVSGYNISETGWSLGEVREVTFRTSNSTYSVDVHAAFDTSDTTKMPYAMEIRFERDDGNIVNVPLTYDSGGTWRGTATFDISGVYTMKYVVYTIKGETIRRYKELEDPRTLDLALGMYVSVESLSGGEDEMFVEEDYAANPGVYHKDVSVKVFDNAGDELKELTGLVLYYTRGGESTLSANLTWNSEKGYYTGTLPIAEPGRYRFANVAMDGNTLTKCTSSPNFVLRSPFTPEYNKDKSVNGANEVGTGIQFVPMTNNAVIDNLTINHSSSADITVVVYSHEAGQYFLRTVDEDHLTYNANDENPEDSYWTVTLPTYYTQDTNNDGILDAGPSQEGDWSVAAILLSGCYKNDEERTAENPIVWGARSADGSVDPISRTWLEQNGQTAEEYLDFTALSTTVSSSVVVEMYPGPTTTLGGDSYEFMHKFYVDTLGLYVTVKDKNENYIPSGKIGGVTLEIVYDPSSATAAEHGYAVKQGMNTKYDLVLKYDTAGEIDRYIVDKEKTTLKYWQFVGDYKVTRLTVNIGGTDQKYTFASGVGVPEKYTVKTAGPDSTDITVALSQSNTQTSAGRVHVLGKSGDSVSGTFLEQQNLSRDISAEISLSADVDGNGLIDIDDTHVTNYVNVADLVSSVALDLKHGGGSEENGGYSWSGTNKLESITCAMRDGGSGIYTPASTSMLAGKYTGTVTVTLKDEDVDPIVKPLPYEIQVYSKMPTLTIKAVERDVSETFDMDTNDGSTSYPAQGIVQVQNYLSSAGDMATVYIELSDSEYSKIFEEQEVRTVKYILPKITLELGNVKSGAGTVGFKTATAVVGNAANSSVTNSFEFLPGTLSVQEAIGGIDTKELSMEEAVGCSGSSSETAKYDIQYNAGEQKITSISMTDANDCVYTVALASPVTIRQENVAPPKITYATVAGYETDFEPVVSETGESFRVTLPKTEDFNNVLKEDQPVESEQVAWTEDHITNTSTEYRYYVSQTYTGDPQTYTKTTGSGCNLVTTTYYYRDFTYHLYQRVQCTYQQQTTVDYYHITTGLIGWKIGDTVYQPGSEYEVTGVVTAVPVIGEIERNKSGKASQYDTVKRITEQDVFVEDIIWPGSQDAAKNGNYGSTNVNDAETTYTKYTPTTSDGKNYVYFNSKNPLDGSSVNTEKHEITG